MAQNNVLIQELRLKLKSIDQRVFDTWRLQIDNKIKNIPLNREILKDILVRMVLGKKCQPFDSTAEVDFTKFNKTYIIQAFQELKNLDPLPKNAENIALG